MHIEQSGARSRALVSALAGLYWFALAACGGSSRDVPSSAATSTTAGGRGGSAAGTAVVALAAHTAGKACSSNGDCDRGSCAKQLPDSSNALLGGGAMIDAPGGYCTATCTVSMDCGEGGSCVSSQQLASLVTGLLGAAGSAGAAASGACYAACTTPDDCRSGYQCVSSFGQRVTTSGSGTCQPTPATDQLPGDVVGSPCAAADDCGAGSCMTSDAFGMSSFPGGYCTGRCLEDGDCGPKGVCSVGFGTSTGTCYRKCEVDSDCERDGYRCRAAAGAGLIPNQTPSTTKQCMPGASPLPDGVVGKACSSDAQCGAAAMSCKMQLTAAFGGASSALPGGYCTQACVDASDCGAGGVCAGALGGFVPGNCWKACTSASDCREGYSCGAAPSLAFPGGMGFPGAMGVPGTTTTPAQTVCAPTPAPSTDQDAGAP